MPCRTRAGCSCRSRSWGGLAGDARLRGQQGAAGGGRGAPQQRHLPRRPPAKHSERGRQLAGAGGNPQRGGGRDVRLRRPGRRGQPVSPKAPAWPTAPALAVHTSNLLRYATAAREKTAHTDVRWAGAAGPPSPASRPPTSTTCARAPPAWPRYPGFGEVREYVARQDGQDVVVPNDEPNRQKFTGYRQLDVVQKVLFQPRPGQRHLLNLQYSTTSNVPRFDRLQTYRNGALRYAEWELRPANPLPGQLPAGADPPHRPLRPAAPYARRASRGRKPPGARFWPSRCARKTSKTCGC